MYGLSKAAAKFRDAIQKAGSACLRALSAMQRAHMTVAKTDRGGMCILLALPRLVVTPARGEHGPRDVAVRKTCPN